MVQFTETFFLSSTPFLNELYVKSSFNGIDSFYSVNGACGLNRVASIAKKNLQQMPENCVMNLLSEGDRVCIHNNLLFIHKEYMRALSEIMKAVSAILNENSGERQAPTDMSLPVEVCARITELNLSGCGIEVLPPQIQLFKNLEKLNLSGNDLKSYPHELKYLPLIEINVSGNYCLQPNRPKWIDRIATVILPNGSKLEKKTTKNLQLFQVDAQFSFFL